jgi:hypothetical protein
VPPAKRSTKATKKARSSKGSMTPAHKSALAEGRNSSRAVRAYLDALETTKPKRGRRLNPAAVRERIAGIDAQLKSASGFEKLNLLADKEALQGKLAGSGDVQIDLKVLRKDFIANAKAFGERKGISYATWRAAGVSAEDLKAAGISRSRG